MSVASSRRIWECGVVSSAGHRRRGKRSREKLRRVQRAGRPAPQFGGLDQDLDPAAVDVDGTGGYVTGVDPAVLADPTATRELLARRRFAVPTIVTSIDGGEEVELDPADEDQRELLILAEHPEYRAVLADPMSDELVEGANPRLHVALHQVIANQLWDDTPPEVWQAARRLLAQGHDRHAILHALAYELSHELYPALTGQHTPDPDMTAYRARLRTL
jgi:hypothetical protein